MNRREWLSRFAASGALFAVSPTLINCQKGEVKNEIAKQTIAANNIPNAKVAFVKTTNRAEGVKRAVELLNFKDEFKDKSVFIKPNFNSADETPGSTHNETLLAVFDELRAMNAKSMTVGDRSGMGNTREVMTAKDIFAMAKDGKIETRVFDDLKQEEWQFFNLKDSFWKKGFAIPKPVLAADRIVNTCCLKTHRYGGHFTLSLKNSVGLAAKFVPGMDYNFMTELHSSPDQRRMIAEINAAYKPSLVVLDGIEAFTDGGPDKGTLVKSEVILAGTDRVAIDAVGVAILRHFGTTDAVEKGKIFEQEQIITAARLGIGIDSPDKIEFLTDDKASAEYAETIRKQFS